MIALLVGFAGIVLGALLAAVALDAWEHHGTLEELGAEWDTPQMRATHERIVVEYERRKAEAQLATRRLASTAAAARPRGGVR